MSDRRQDAGAPGGSKRITADEPDTRAALEAAMFFADAYFYRQLVNSIVRRPEESGLIAMALMPWFSLFVFESRRYFRSHGLANDNFELEHQEQIARMRHSLKWMDQPQTAAEQWITRFDKLIERHRIEFTGNTPHLWARSLETDLGLYSYSDTVFATTHSISFALDIEDISDAGPFMHDIGKVLSSYIGSVTSDVEDNGPTFIDALRELEDRDVKSWNYYKGFGHAHGSIGYLRSLWAALGLIELIGDDTPAPFTFGAHKMRHVVVHQVLATLRILADDDTHLELRQMDINGIVRESESRAAVLATKEAKYLRNALVHFSLDARVKVVAADFKDALFGLPAIHGLTVASSDLVDTARREVSALRRDLGEALERAGR